MRKRNKFIQIRKEEVNHFSLQMTWLYVENPKDSIKIF